MSWGWRKILQVREKVRPFIWNHLGNGASVSAWFDNWCALSPLSSIVSNRDIYIAGFRLDSKVHEIIDHGSWSSPNAWASKYPSLVNITVPHLSNNVDRLMWRNLANVDLDFSVVKVWDCIRPRSNEVDWFHVVWFSHQIPRHAILLWLVITRKLKTQDNLRQRDVGSNANLNLLRCPLCETQPDSHDHLFFDCRFSLHVWEHLKHFSGISNIPFKLNSIVDFLIPSAKLRWAMSVIAKLIFAASCYFIWQERNERLFRKKKRSHDQVIDVIKSNVRLKLLACRFKKSPHVQTLLHLWKLPMSLMDSSR
ncbi:putative reverse transcriptase zinc-binding domain-containing protein [Tanacetum coccineum]